MITSIRAESTSETTATPDLCTIYGTKVDAMNQTPKSISYAKEASPKGASIVARKLAKYTAPKYINENITEKIDTIITSFNFQLNIFSS